MRTFPKSRAHAARGAIRHCLVYLFAAVAQAEIQTQHILDTSRAIGPVEPLWHFRIRTTPEGGGVAQIRTGPILNLNVHDRATLIGGYYFTRAKEESHWSTTHRSFAGAEVAAWTRRVEIDLRSLVERFSVIAGPDLTRFRNRLRISPSGTTAPYAGVEVFLDADGFRSLRYSAGLRRKLTDELSVDIGYFYENRQSRAGSDRHVLGTTIHWRDKSRRMDADP